MVGAHHGGVGTAGELAVAGDVVAVAVGVQHQQLVAVAGMGGQPAGQQAVHGGAQREELLLRGGAGVHQQRPVVAEQQVQERRLVVDRLVLAQDHGVVVVAVDLELRVAVVPTEAWIQRTSRSPGGRVRKSIGMAPSSQRPPADFRRLRGSAAGGGARAAGRDV